MGRMKRLVLLRHGESVWNRENRFTGWTDVDLSEKGFEEARRAGCLIREAGLPIDIAYTSLLKRAIRTLWIVLDELDRMWIPVHATWHLNERHYGALQGLSKSETAARYGEAQVHRWRRGYADMPPLLERSDNRYPGNDPRYRNIPERDLPLGESLKLTVERFLPYWNGVIAPSLGEGRAILISAHGNSLRALIKHLDRISDEQISGLNIPTGIPLVYEFGDDLEPVRHFYLGDPVEARESARKVAEQGRAIT